jgi:hypothetical protein
MKRHVTYITIMCFVCAILTAGCDSNSMAIKYALARYLSAAGNGRYEEAYKYISENDKAVKSLEESLPEQEWKEGPLKRYLAGYVAYNVQEIIISGDSAKAKITVTAPNYSLIHMDIPEFDITRAPVEGDYGTEMVKLLKKTYEGNLPTITEAKNIDLIKEGATWKIFLNWKEEKELEAKLEEEQKVLLDEEIKKQEEMMQKEKMLLKQKEEQIRKSQEQMQIESEVRGKVE